MQGFKIAFLCLVITILAFSTLGASEFSTCSNCKQAFTTRNLYCEHCGAWWTSPDHIIKNEFTIIGDYYKMDIDAIGLDTLANPAPYTQMEDTLSFGLKYRRYFNTRYQHPIVPMSFIPYNFRSSYIEFSAGLSNINYEFDFPGAAIHSKQGKSRKAFSVNSIYHLKIIFFGGNLMYNNFTIDDLDSDEYSDKVVSFGGSLGYHNTMAKLGVNLQHHKITMKRSYGDEDKNCTSVYPFIEYLPTPTMLISTGFIYGSNSGDEDNDEYTIPVQLRYVTHDNWWEFVFSFSYNDEEDGLNILDMALEVNKMFMDASIFIKPQYIKRTREDINGAYKVTRINFGGTHAFMKRKIMLTVSGFYGFGESDFVPPEADITDYKGQASLNIFF